MSGNPNPAAVTSGVSPLAFGLFTSRPCWSSQSILALSRSRMTSSMACAPALLSNDNHTAYHSHTTYQRARCKQLSALSMMSARSALLLRRSGSERFLRHCRQQAFHCWVVV